MKYLVFKSYIKEYEYESPCITLVPSVTQITKLMSLYSNILKLYNCVGDGTKYLADVRLLTHLLYQMFVGSFC